MSDLGSERRNWLRQRKLTIIIGIAFLFVSAIDFEQSRVIEAQRSLIRLLAADSNELAVRKVQQIQRQR